MKIPRVVLCGLARDPNSPREVCHCLVVGSLAHRARETELAADEQAVPELARTAGTASLSACVLVLDRRRLTSPGKQWHMNNTICREKWYAAHNLRITADSAFFAP